MRRALSKEHPEFREHLGGRLTIMLLSEIGTGTEVHSIDEKMVAEAISLLRERQTKVTLAATLV